MVLQKSCKTGVDRDVSERKERQLCAREWQFGSVTLHVLVTGILGKEYTVGL